MVSRKEYERKPFSYWKRVHVRTTTVMQNGFMEIPSGTVCRIANKHGGFTLKTEPCKTCGVCIFIRKVAPEHVDIVEVEESITNAEKNT